MEEQNVLKRASSVAAPSSDPAPKRQKLSPSPTSSPSTLETQSSSHPHIANMEPNKGEHSLPRDIQLERERSVGILHFVHNDSPGFSGILKQRQVKQYTDFLVNEITSDGTVVHLTRIHIPKSKHQPLKPQLEQSQQVVEVPTVPKQQPPKAENIKPNPTIDPDPKSTCLVSDGDKLLLETYFGAATRSAILFLDKQIRSDPSAKPSSFGSIVSDPITDRQLRTQIHQDIRRIFCSRIETASDGKGAIKMCAAARANPNPRNGSIRNPNVNQQKGKLGWTELGGEYLHFTLYKENKDTMEVIRFIANKLHLNDRDVSSAGTKDRRAVTVQRLCARRVRAEQVAMLNQQLYGAKVGNFTYERYKLELSDSGGNEFQITLRDCRFKGYEKEDCRDVLKYAKVVVADAMGQLKGDGYLNYYGLQRFGTYTTGTDLVGKKILQGDYEGAVNAILAYDLDVLEAAFIPAEEHSAEQATYSKDDVDRAWAIFKFNRTRSSKLPLERLPRRFNAEGSIIRYLGVSSRSKDFLGALLSISRSLKLMFVHAYQSLVWNHIASQRWATYGSKIVEGDLVLVDMKLNSGRKIEKEEVDQDGEVVVVPGASDAALTSDDLFQRARAITAEEAASGKYKIFDIVLPSPGFDVEYPANEIGDYYKTFMASETGGGLDPANMRRPNRDFSMSGSYRPLMGTIGEEVSVDIRYYYEDNEQMVETDLEKLTGEKRPEPRVVPPKAFAPMVPNKESDARKAAAANWRALPAKLAAEDETDVEAKTDGEVLITKPLNEPKIVVDQTTFKDTYIQTSIESGKCERTGVRQTTIIPPTDGSEMPPPLPPKSVDRPSIFATPMGQSAFPAPPSAQSTLSGDSDGGVHIATPPESEGFQTEEGRSTASDSDTDPLAGGVMLKQFKIAAVVKFQLGSSQYATMALRELMKEGGLREYQSAFSAPRFK